ncbi:uncharacterized protein, partial [Musca autumnalis]|uniref:uncharacterized protein n=1 Tax=Musca autumnalis TaxID=221902 RepID=UPI003CF26F6C
NRRKNVSIKFLFCFKNVLHKFVLRFSVLFASLRSTRQLQSKTLCILYASVLPTIIRAYETEDRSNATLTNVKLTHWREHRRQKRHLIYPKQGVFKLNFGYGYPIDLGDHRPWRTLAVANNLQFNYGIPTTALHWWNSWHVRALQNKFDGVNYLGPVMEPLNNFEKDEPQLFLYTWMENLMTRQNENGRECLLKAICENAQIDVHQGLYAEILYRFLRPHRNLESHYVNAWQMGLDGVDCQSSYPKAVDCLLDRFTHVREEYMGHTRVIKHPSFA